MSQGILEHPSQALVNALATYGSDPLYVADKHSPARHTVTGQSEPGQSPTLDTTAASTSDTAAAASSLKYERMKDLEGTLLIRISENEALRHRREELLETSRARAQFFKGAGRANPTTRFGVPREATGPKQSNGARRPQHISNDPNSPLSMPILDLVDGVGSAKGVSLFDIPMHELGNVILELDIALKMFQQHKDISTKTLAEVRGQIFDSERRQKSTRENINKMAELVGLATDDPWRRPIPSPAVKAQEEEYELRSTAPGPRMLRQYAAINKAAEANGAPPDRDVWRDMKRDNDAMQRQIVSLQREAKAARAVLIKKRQGLKDLEGQLEDIKGEEGVTLDLYNNIRTVNRDITERKIVLRKLLEDHERIDVLLDDAYDDLAASPLAIVDADLRAMRERAVRSSEDDKGLQERVLKAQEFRLGTLNRRINMVNSSLRTHRLDADVDAMVAEALQLQQRMDLESASKAIQKQLRGGSSSQTRGASGGALTTATSPILSRTDGPGAGALVNAATMQTRARTRGGGAKGKVNGTSLVASRGATEIGALAQEDLYDIDSIIPPNESVHPAVYSLFLSEKEKAGKRAGLMRMLLAEKCDAYRATELKLQKMIYEYQDVADELFMTTKDVKNIESDQKAAVLEELVSDRLRLQDITSAKTVLQRELFAQDHGGNADESGGAASSQSRSVSVSKEQ